MTILREGEQVDWVSGDCRVGREWEQGGDAYCGLVGE